MRTTIHIDDELFAKAAKLTGPLDRSAMVREGLKALIERESARRLARLGGTQKEIEITARRRLGPLGPRVTPRSSRLVGSRLKWPVAFASQIGRRQVP